MSDKTKIEWTDATWNPLVGCSRVSAGCINCYAERHAYRFARQPGTVYEGTARLVNGKPTFTGRVNLNERVLDLPLRWKRPRRIFVNSMSDLFHESVSDETIDRIFAVMALAPQHTFQVLTKRPERMRAYLCGLRDNADHAWRFRGALDVNIEPKRLHRFAVAFRKGEPLPNVWLGVSVEDQAAADERIELLLQTPAAVRFLSCEPLLGDIRLESCLQRSPSSAFAAGKVTQNMPTWTRIGAAAIDWVIAGGESGPRARPMHPDWARSLRDQCAAAGVPFFFKQWGEWAPGESCGAPPTRTEQTAELFGDSWSFGELTPRQHYDLDIRDEPDLYRVGKHAAGRVLDGVAHNAYPHEAHARSHP